MDEHDAGLLARGVMFAQIEILKCCYADPKAPVFLGVSIVTINRFFFVVRRFTAVSLRRWTNNENHMKIKEM